MAAALIDQQQIRLYLPCATRSGETYQPRQPLWRTRQHRLCMGKSVATVAREGAVTAIVRAGSRLSKSALARPSKALLPRPRSALSTRVVGDGRAAPGGWRAAPGLIHTQWPARIEGMPGLATGRRIQRAPGLPPAVAPGGEMNPDRPVRHPPAGQPALTIRIRVGRPRLPGGVSSSKRPPPAACPPRHRTHRDENR